MAARSWEQFDADLAAGRNSNAPQRYEIDRRDSRRLEDIPRDGVAVKKYSPGVAWKTTWLGPTPWWLPKRGRAAA
jgi:hypothetical protein